MLPSRSLIVLIAGITVVPLLTLLWLGWRLLEQDRVLEEQQAQQRVERATDLAIAAIQRAISSDEQRLAAGGGEWPEGSVTLTFHSGHAEAQPRERLAWLPVAVPLPEAPIATFAQGEELEFRQRDYAAAANIFRELAKSGDAAVRAGALLRLARNLRAAGKQGEALAAYARLTTMDGVSTGAAPAGLAARYARCKLLEETNRPAELLLEARLLESELRSARWPLTAALYWLYAGDAARWSGAAAVSTGPQEVFAEAAAALWERRNLLAASGRESISIGDQPVAVLWLTAEGRLRVLLASREFAGARWLSAAAPVLQEQRISLQIGEPHVTSALRSTRKAKDSALPWDIVTASLDAPGHQSEFVSRRRLLIVGFVLLVSMAMAASYLIFRAVSRELAVARLQSDFVAAVSHEFRTPLTTLRQFTDRLREHGGLDDERRRVCYEAQSRATDRLTRLVESLLDFGRMEAGKHRYQFEPRDCTQLVQSVVEDFRSQTSGHEIEFHGNGAAQVESDGESLSRAVWNLLDNAVKYSPDHRTVEVDIHRRDATVSISVRDHGIGISAHERAAIFSKFHRGEQARKRGIKGTGIGLAMVDQIVKAHRGRVEVQSEPGKGSTFTIVLPVKES